MQQLKCTEIKKRFSLMRYFFPFQSREQFKSFIAFLAVGEILVLTLIYSFDKKAPLVAIAICAALASVPALFAVLPAEFKIFTRNPNRLLAETISNEICHLGYIKFSTMSKSEKFKVNLPACLSWKENEIHCEVDATGILIRGPIFSAKTLRNNILKKDLVHE